MYIVKNALRNIFRSKGRNILIGIIVLVIATSSCVALSIKESAAKAEKEGLENLSITGQITVDRSAMVSKAQSGSGDMKSMMAETSSLSLDELEKYAASSYVSDFYYTMTSSVDAYNDTVSPVDTSSSDTSSTTSSSTPNDGRQPQGGGQNIPQGMGTQGDFSLVGYSSQTAMTDFISGVCQVTDGSLVDLSTSDNTCLITDELAALNSLAVGDTITIENPNKTDETYTLTVSGIYSNSESSSEQDGMRFSTSSDPANRIVVSTGTMSSIISNSESVATTSTDSTSGTTSTTALRNQVSGTYVFADNDALESFKTDVQEMGLSDTYTVTSSDVTSYEQSIVPLKNLSKFAGVFLLIVLLIGGIILVVLNIFNVHERKYEVGVLTAIGMKKWKVACQYILELFTVTIAAIIVGTVAGSIVSVPVANALLASQVSSQQSQSQKVSQNFGQSPQGDNTQNTPPSGNGNQQGGGFGGFIGTAGGNVVSYISNINTSTDVVVVLELFLIGLALTILSSSAAIVSILRYEPLKILTSRT